VDYAEVVRLNALDKAREARESEGALSGLGAPSDKLKPRTPAELVRELRWANLGLVYRVSGGRCVRCPAKSTVDDQELRL
jgi:hypothetical protein